MDATFVETLKKEYMEYGGQTPYDIIVHLQTKISKVTNRDKLQLKKEVFIAWDQPQVLSAYFIQIEKAKKQLAKWKVTMLDDDIIFLVVDQMYECE